MATIDGAATARPGLGDRELGRGEQASHRAEQWPDWFAPARDLRPRLVDLLFAAAIAFIQLPVTIAYAADEPGRWEFDRFAFGLLLAGPLALLFRRRWPEATLVVALAIAAGYAATGYPRAPGGLPAFAAAMASAIMMGRHAFAWGALMVAFPAFVWLPLLVPDEVESARSLADSAVVLAWLPLAGATSEIARIRRERRAERAHAEQEEARRHASEERMRIARELHDVLAHNISLINVQSGVALHLLDKRPEQARPALEAINEASEEALGELRSALDVLHSGGEDWAPRGPTAGLRDVGDLVRRTRAAGLDVQLTIAGDARPVPAGVDLAAFRIVQEALTNVVRHAGGEARAAVRVTYAPAELVVQIDDDGRAAAPPNRGAGRGIAGMQERAQALGGTFAAGPRPGRGFRVRARYPLQTGPR